MCTPRQYLWQYHLYLEDESDFTASDMEGASLIPVVNFVLFLRSSCSCKKTTVCQDADFLVTVRKIKYIEL